MTSGIRGVKRHREGARPSSANACDRFPLGLVRCHDGRKGPEVREQSTRADGRNARHAGESRLSGRRSGFSLRALCVGRAVAGRSIVTSLRESIEPKSRLSHIERLQERHANVRHRDTHTANRGGRQRAVVEVAALHQYICKPSRSAEFADLGPERSGDDRCVESANGFALHECAAPEVVVSSTERPELDARAILGKQLWHSTCPLVHVGDDRNHDETVARCRRPMRHRRAPNLCPLALSRSDSA